MVVATLGAVADAVARDLDGDAPPGTLYRFLLSLPVLRLIGAVSASRRVMFGLASVVHVFSALLGVVVVIYYVFACFGCLAFDGWLSDLPESTYEDAQVRAADEGAGCVRVHDAADLTPPLRRPILTASTTHSGCCSRSA